MRSTSSCGERREGLQSWGGWGGGIEGDVTSLFYIELIHQYLY